MKHLDYKFNLRSDRDNIEFNRDHDSYIGLYLQASSKRLCPWHTALNTLANGVTSIRDYYADVKQRYFNREIDRNTLAKGLEPIAATAKTCPAINHVLENSFLVLAPCDIHISVSSTGEFLCNSASTNLINIMSHPSSQFVADGSELFKNHVNLKFELPVLLNSHKVPYVFLQPVYHSDLDWIIPPGAITGSDTVAQQLNINTFFAIPDAGVNNVYIRAGTVLAYIWFPERVTLRYSDRIQAVDIQQRYVGSKFYYRDK